jgi:hypothetical protein
LKHVAALLADPDRSRARSHLQERGLLELLPRLSHRPPALVDLFADPRLVLGGSSAARLLEWQLPDGSWPVEAYISDRQLADVVERYALERDEEERDFLLRASPEPWPFPPRARGASAGRRGRPERICHSRAGCRRQWQTRRVGEKMWSRTGASVRHGGDRCGRSCPVGFRQQLLQKRSEIVSPIKLWDDRAETDAEHWSDCCLWLPNRSSTRIRRARCVCWIRGEQLTLVSAPTSSRSRVPTSAPSAVSILTVRLKR